MITKTLTLIAGISGAATMSQFPEFSQQYVQRLGGAVDSLQMVVDDFNASAQKEGLTQEEALEQMTGSDFIVRRKEDMVKAITRLDTLQENLASLEGANALSRLQLIHHMSDTEALGAVWKSYQPAVQLTLMGMVFTGLGFFLGALLASILLGVTVVLSRRAFA